MPLRAFTLFLHQSLQVECQSSSLCPFFCPVLHFRRTNPIITYLAIKTRLRLNLGKRQSIWRYPSQDSEESQRPIKQQTVPAYGQNTDSLKETIINLYRKGITTMEIAELIEKMYGNHYSRGTISNMAASIQTDDVKNVRLGDVSELDETFVLDCYKGRKFCNNMSRKSRKHGAKGEKRGIPNKYACICAGIQHNGEAFAATINGGYSTQFSSSKSRTRSNSQILFVTRIIPSALA